MGYDWDAHRDECYRVYVQERRSMDELIEFMKSHHRFTPSEPWMMGGNTQVININAGCVVPDPRLFSKRAFQAQIRKWAFPSKQVAAASNTALVDRVRELWEANKQQREILRVLHAEGFDVSPRQLLRLRTNNRWLMRVPKTAAASPSPRSDVHGSSSSAADGPQPGSGEAGGGGDHMPAPADGDGGARLAGAISGDRSHAAAAAAAGPPPPRPVVVAGLDTLAATAAALRQEQRRRQLEAESSERWETRKRRRRTRAWAGLPADPPGPPRFPSETTLTESKRLLGLDHDTYRDVRARFLCICDEARLDRKTVAGHVAWEGAKARLVRETPHLLAVMSAPLALVASSSSSSSSLAPSRAAAAADEEGDGDRGEARRARQQQQQAMDLDMDLRRALALDVICTDVTKRKRSTENDRGRRPTLAEVKNVLGVNPDESRRLRQVFTAILRDESITSKLEVGPERWEELKQKWRDACPELRRALPSTRAAAEDGQAKRRRVEVLRAMELLAGDAIKRYRDEQNAGRLRLGAAATERTDVGRGRSQVGDDVSYNEPSSSDPSPSSKMRMEEAEEEQDGTGGGALGLVALGGADHGLGAATYEGGHVDEVAHPHAMQLSLGLPGAPDPVSQLQMVVSAPGVSLEPPPLHHHLSRHQHHNDAVVVDPATGLALGPQMDSALLDAEAAAASVFVDDEYMEDMQQQLQQQHTYQSHDPDQGVQDAQEQEEHQQQDGAFSHAQQQAVLAGGPGLCWNTTLTTTTTTSLDELPAAAADKFPGCNACVAVEGVLPPGGKDGHDDDDDDGRGDVAAAAAVRDGSGGGGRGVPIESDVELAAYLEAVRALGAAPAYNVQVMHYGVN